MTLSQRGTLRLLPASALGGLMPALAIAQTTPDHVRPFRIVTQRGEVTLGFTPAELAAMGDGDEVERVARRLARDGQVTGWRYTVTRAPDGSTQFAARDKLAVMRQEAVTIEPYRAALPVTAPPR